MLTFHRVALLVGKRFQYSRQLKSPYHKRGGFNWSAKQNCLGNASPNRRAGLLEDAFERGQPK